LYDYFLKNKAPKKSKMCEKCEEGEWELRFFVERNVKNKTNETFLFSLSLSRVTGIRNFAQHQDNIFFILPQLLHEIP